MENLFSDREGTFLTLGKRLCSDPGAVVPLLSDVFAFPLPHVGTAPHPAHVLEQFGSDSNGGDSIPAVSIKICRQQDIGHCQEFILVEQILQVI